MYLFFMTNLNSSFINNFNIISLTISLKVKPVLKVTLFNCAMQSYILTIRFIRSFDNILETSMKRIHHIYKSFLEIKGIFKNMLLISVYQLYCLFIFQVVILVDWLSDFTCFRFLIWFWTLLF